MGGEIEKADLVGLAFLLSLFVVFEAYFFLSSIYSGRCLTSS